MIGDVWTLCPACRQSVYVRRGIMYTSTGRHEHGHRWSNPNPEDATLYCLNKGCLALMPMLPDALENPTGACPVVVAP